MSIINPRAMVEFNIVCDADPSLMNELSIDEITMTEGLMSPTLQTKIVIHNNRNVGYVKNLDDYANANLTINTRRLVLGDYGYNDQMSISNQVFRVSERKRYNDQVDQFELMATDASALKNASRRMSKSWKCTPPHAIVADALKGCVGVDNLFMTSSTPPRTYFAENIHPYQVVAQQADVALAGGNDPSFLHYITYENFTGTHRFESLYDMTRRASIIDLHYVEDGKMEQLWENPEAIMDYEFPCDFDLISDLMNGVDGGKDFNSLLLINPFNGMHSIIGGNNAQCGMGGSEGDVSFTNKKSAAAEGNCEIDVERHKLKRTARLGLLDGDKVALRLTVGYNPNLHAGKMIKAKFPNKVFDTQKKIKIQDDYGTGYYLITALTHNLKQGGWGTTVIDCVSKSVGNGGQTRG